MTDVSLPDSPKGVLHAFRDAWNRHDADELASIFAPDATFVNVTGLWWNTREKIKTAHAYGFEKDLRPELNEGGTYDGENAR